MPMPGRKYQTGDAYRYGFNGKENDNEVVGTGEGTQDYGLRIYNPALGRFLSVDPLTKSFPWYTPYQFAGNKPIWAIDLDGAEELPTNTGPTVRPSNTYRPSGGYRTTNGGYPAGRSANRGSVSGTNYLEGGDLEMEPAPRAHSTYDPSKYVWFDANGHPQTEVEAPPVVEPIKDPFAQKLSQNLTQSKLEETEKSKPIGLGVDENLYVHRGKAVTYKNAGWQKAKLTNVNWDKASDGGIFFRESFRQAAQNASGIQFNVQDLTEKRYMTMYEFNYITSNPDLLFKTEFFDNDGPLEWNGEKLIRK